MEHIVEWNSFFKKFKQAIADQNIEVNPDDVLYDIESSISFIKDMDGFDIKVRKDKGLTYKGHNGVVTLPFEKNFFYITISSNIRNGKGEVSNNEFIGFNIEDIKDDLVGCIDYIRSKYPVSDLRIGITLPKRKVSHDDIFTGIPTDSWVAQDSSSKYINLDDIKNAEDFDIYSISVFIVI